MLPDTCEQWVKWILEKSHLSSALFLDRGPCHWGYCVTSSRKGISLVFLIKIARSFKQQSTYILDSIRKLHSVCMCVCVCIHALHSICFETQLCQIYSYRFMFATVEASSLTQWTTHRNSASTSTIAGWWTHLPLVSQFCVRQDPSKPDRGSRETMWARRDTGGFLFWGGLFEKSSKSPFPAP